VKRALMIAILLCLGPTSARAETIDQAYARAVQDYYAGRYERAVEGLERIATIPLEHEDLHYNLGCAYFRLGRLGPAIYHFERALLLDPGAEDASFNLETTRAQVAASVKDELRGAASEPWWVRVVSALSLHSWTVIFLCLWWASLGLLLLLRFLSPGPARSGLIAGDSLLGLLALIAALILAGRIYLGARVPSGIVLPDQLAVREGPDGGTKVSFTIHAGLRVRLQTKGEGWTRIRLANGLEGWVPEKEIGRL
jgi:tetratricopeptide (TPR) repeat protein